MTPTTRLIYVETLTNPLVQMADLEAVVAFAQANGLVSMIDNTFASPVLCRPAELGFDLVMESATKYMNGHNDLVAGSVSGSAGAHPPDQAHARPPRRIARSPRLRAARAGAQDHRPPGAPAVERTRWSWPAFWRAVRRSRRSHYPGLASHAQHARAARLLSGGFGGMMAFVHAGGGEAADAFASRLELPTVAASLGGVESLIIRPAAAIHSGLPPEARAEMGINEGADAVFDRGGRRRRT